MEDNEGSPAQLNTETSCRCISSNRSYGSRCFIVPSAAGATRETEGIDKLTATVLLAELGDISRFESPKQLMAYLGLVPSEHSTGLRRRQVAIMLTGNGHAGRMLVESAWSCRFPSRQTMHLKRKASMASARRARTSSWCVWPSPASWWALSGTSSATRCRAWHRSDPPSRAERRGPTNTVSSRRNETHLDSKSIQPVWRTLGQATPVSANG